MVASSVPSICCRLDAGSHGDSTAGVTPVIRVTSVARWASLASMASQPAPMLVRSASLPGAPGDGAIRRHGTTPSLRTVAFCQRAPSDCSTRRAGSMRASSVTSVAGGCEP